MPRDEAFSEIKGLMFSAKTVFSVLHAVVPSLETALIDSDLPFPYFAAINQLYNVGITMPKLPTKGFSDLLPRLVKAIEEVTGDVLQFETPEAMLRKKTRIQELEI